MDKNEIFIEKAKKIHGDKYDYSSVIYINNSTPVKIGYDGIFYMVTPANHLKGSKIEKIKTKHTLSSFIESASYIHSENYIYDKVNFRRIKDKIIITCKKHGDFTQVAIEHLNGHGCSKCGKEKMAEKIKKSKDDILKLIKDKHGDKFTYKNLNGNISFDYILDIICPKHGEFKQKIINHINHDCKKCSFEREYNPKLTEDFINRSKIIHNNIYNYDKTIYIKNSLKCIVTCKLHGDFEITPNSHIGGAGCRKCGYINRKHHKKLNTEQLITKFKEVHGDKYDYSKVVYKNTRSKIIINCKLHGDFNQNAGSHLYGKNGCPNCNDSVGVKIIKTILNKSNIEFETEYKFEGCKNKLYLPFDFYLPNLNTCIEFDGVQHFGPNKFFDKTYSFKDRKRNDKIKNDFCVENYIKLIRIPYWEIKNIENILKNNKII